MQPLYAHDNVVKKDKIDKKLINEHDKKANIFKLKYLNDIGELLKL